MRRFLFGLVLIVWIGCFGYLLNVQASVVCVKSTPTPTPSPTPGGSTITLGGSNYTIASHPRLSLTSLRLTALRTRSISGKTLYDKLVTNANSLISTCATDSFNITMLYQFAVAYLSDPTKTAWRDCAIAHFNRIKDLTTSYDNCDYGRQDAAVFAYVYDILYNDLTPTQRSNYLDWMFNIWLPWLQTYNPSNFGAYCIHGTSCECVKTSGATPTHNACITGLWGEYLVGLSCLGDDSRCNDLVTYDYNWWHTTPGVKATVDTWMANGCHGIHGSSYGRNRSVPYILEVADGEDTALGMTASWMSWMDDCPKWFIHSTTPDFVKIGCPYTGTVCAQFDAEGYPGQNTYAKQGRDLRGILLPILRNPSNTDMKKAEYWLQNDHTPSVSYGAPGYVVSGTLYGAKEYLPEWHLRYDQDGPWLNYNTWPTTYIASSDYYGVMYSRDAWGPGDKFWMTAYASSWFGDKQAAGMCGSLKLFKNGEFGIVENGAKYAAGDFDTNKSTAAYDRNIIVLGDGLVGGNQTGGMPLYGADQTCSIAKSSYGATYAYAHLNLDGAYVAGTFPVSYVRRNIVHLKPITIGGASSTVNYVVVLDALSPTNAITAAQQWHVPATSPTISDPTVTMTLTNTRTIIQRVYPTGATIAAGTSVSDLTADSSCPQCGTGIKQVRITDTADTYHFLGSVITMQGTSGTMPTLTAINGDSGNFVGVLVGDGNVPRIVLVRKDNSTKSNATWTFGSTAHSGTEYIIAGLTSGSRWDHAFATPTHTMTYNAGSGAITADSMGVARFTD